MSESKAELSSSAHLTLPPGSQSQKLKDGPQSCESFSLLFIGRGNVLRKSYASVNVETPSSTSTSPSKAFKEDSNLKASQDDTIEEDVFTLGEVESKTVDPLHASSSTSVFLYKVEPTFLDDPVRRADLARVLPSMHAVVFVCRAEDRHNRFDAVAQSEASWLPFVNEHANRHMLRAFVVPPSTASAPGWDVQVKPGDVGKNVQMHVKNISNSDDVRAFSLELLQPIRSSLPESERSLFSSTFSDLPSTGTRRLMRFSEASQAGNNRITVADVLQQMQAGDDVSKLHHQTPFTSYVSSLMSNISFAFSVLSPSEDSISPVLQRFPHSSVWAGV